jgi:hypothetical protein
MAVSNSVPERAAIRAELEQTRVAFHRLLDSLSEADWKRKSRNPAWTTGELMSHMAQILDFYRNCIENARRGKATVPGLPLPLLNWLNAFDTRRKARKATSAQVAQSYDANHARLLALLNTIQPHDWGLKTRSPLSPGGYLTIEAAFHGPTTHFKEHREQVMSNE